MPLRFVVFAAASMILIAAAEAATVQVFNGPVYVNRGEGFQRISGATEAGPGDTAMAGAGGSGQLVYDDGCKVDIAPGSTVSVQERSPCRRGGAPWFNYALGAAIVGGTITAIIVTEDDDGPVSP
jgi:hypothetical protein